jgi:hypothetical protein
MVRVLPRFRLLVVWALLLAAPALAEPYIAVREGLPCSACHVNVTGGGKRTDLVSTHARDILHYPNFFGPLSNPPEFFSGEVNKYIAIGSDLRASNTAVFQDLGSNSECSGAIQQQSPTTRCVSNDKVFRGRLEKNRMDVTEAELYGEVRLIPDYLTFYLDQQFQPTTNNREAFGLLRGLLPWNGYVKGGQMFLPYGLQLQDDQAFIRGGRTNGSSSISTGFSFNNSEPAFEIGFAPGPFSLVAAVSDGSSDDRDVRVTTTVSAMFTELPVVRNVLLGGSFSRVGPPDRQSLLFGFFGGSNFERFTALTEVDFLSDSSSMTNGRTVGRFIFYGEGDYLLFGWLNVKATGEYSDNDGTLGDTDDSENQVTVGLEPFLTRFLQPRLFYQINNGISTDPTHNQNLLVAEMHLFF